MKLKLGKVFILFILIALFNLCGCKSKGLTIEVETLPSSVTIKKDYIEDSNQVQKYNDLVYRENSKINSIIKSIKKVKYEYIDANKDDSKCNYVIKWDNYEILIINQDYFYLKTPSVNNKLCKCLDDNFSFLDELNFFENELASIKDFSEFTKISLITINKYDDSSKTLSEDELLEFLDKFNTIKYAGSNCDYSNLDYYYIININNEKIFIYSNEIFVYNNIAYVTISNNFSFIEDYNYEKEPVSPDDPDIPDEPDIPDNPDIPDIPNEPDIPDDPDNANTDWLPWI